MKKLFSFAIIAMMMLFCGTTAFAQDWTKDQTDVWKVSEDIWMKWKAGDIDGMAAYFHDNYQGWSSDSPLPVGKVKILDWYRQTKDMMKVNFVSLNPARITITGSAAVVDYYFSGSMTYTEGDKQETEEITGKNVEFYVKEGGKWLLLGDMTVFEEKED